MKIPQATASGFKLDAFEFLKAAELVLNRAAGVSLPAYFLLSRSIELSLKSFLLSHGRTAKELSSHELGHNLTALFSEVNKNQLTQLFMLDQVEMGALELLSAEYLSTKLGYRVTDATYYLPPIEIAEEIARKLVRSLEDAILSASAPP